MARALFIFGVAFAAVWIWLGVRIFNRRERWAIRAGALVVSLPLFYALSFGPACWRFSHPVTLPRGAMPAYRRVSTVYSPIGWAASRGPKLLRSAINWYATIGLSDEIMECEIEPFGEFQITGFAK